MRKRLTLLTAVVVASLIAAVAPGRAFPTSCGSTDPVLVYGGPISRRRRRSRLQGDGQRRLTPSSATRASSSTTSSSSAVKEGVDDAA